MEEVGCQDVRVIQGKHYQIRFSFAGAQAGPVVVATTPSDRNAVRIEAGHFLRELKRLGAEPSLGKELKRRLGSIAAVSTFRTGSDVQSYRTRKTLWDQLEEVANGNGNIETVNLRSN